MNNDSLEQFNNAKELISDLKDNLTAKRGARDQLIKVQKKEQLLLDEYKDKQRLSYMAQIFLLSEVADRRSVAIDSIEKIGTFALRLVYGKGYKLKFNTFDDKRKEGTSNFKMEINIVSPFEGGELTTGLMGERGGGVIEIVAFALRIAALSWSHYEGPLILDEAYKSMSNDGKLNSVARFLRAVTEQTGRQIIFATHRSEIFGDVSNNMIQVEKRNGVSVVGLVENIPEIDEEE